MLLAEDLLILLVDSATTDRPRRRETKPLLAAALLMELAAAGRLGIYWDTRGKLFLTVEDTTPFGEQELDRTLAHAILMESETCTDVLLALVPGLHVRLLNRLVARGWLARRWLSRGWRPADLARREYLRGWLAAVLRGEWPMDWNSGALITLLEMAGATELVTSKPELAERAEAIATGNWPAGEVSEAFAAKCVQIVRYWSTHGATGFVGRQP